MRKKRMGLTKPLQSQFVFGILLQDILVYQCSTLDIMKGTRGGSREN